METYLETSHDFCRKLEINDQFLISLHAIRFQLIASVLFI